MRNLAIGMALVCFVGSPVHASLQIALENALFGQGAQAIQVPIGIFLRNPLPPIPEGALFIDPITSTRGEAVFREGPAFDYDPTTGGVTVFAPPMLGPADEFGVRLQYSPVSINVLGNDFLDENPSIPRVTKYRRNEPEISQIDWRPLPFDEDAPSFVIDEFSDFFSLNVSSADISVNVGSRRNLTGAEVSFTSLLVPGLEADVFEAEEDTLLPNSIWPYLPRIAGTLPDVHFVVNYNADFSVVGVGLSSRYSLLAVPQADLFQNDEPSIPEPSTALLACVAGFAILFRRDRRQLL